MINLFLVLAAGQMAGSYRSIVEQAPSMLQTYLRYPYQQYFQLEKDMIEGGCLCGALRYRSAADPIESAYCHCRMCQKASGAPVVAWTVFAAESFAYTKGEPAIYRSSSNGQREYCGTCGSQILFRHSDTPDTVDINSCTADRPEVLVPEYHIFCDSRMSWFETNDELPRYGDAGPN